MSPPADGPRVDRVERLGSLVAMLLAAERPMTLAEIRSELGTIHYPEAESGRRRFEFDKRLLRAEGIPLETVPGRDPSISAYRIDPAAFYLPDLDLVEEERLALAAAASAVSLEGTDWATRASWTLGAGVTDGLPTVTLPAAETLAVLHEAATRRSTVEFDHGGTRRTLDPWAVMLRDGFCYVVGRYHERDEPRAFRVDRIDGKVVVGDAGAFAVPDGVDPRSVLESDPLLIGHDDPVEALVRVDPVAAPRVLLERGEDAVAERQDGGTTTFRVTVRNREGFRSWVLGLLDHAEVLEPLDLRDDVRSWLSAVAGA